MRLKNRSEKTKREKEIEYESGRVIRKRTDEKMERGKPSNHFATESRTYLVARLRLLNKAADAHRDERGISILDATFDHRSPVEN